ncbi:MAG: type II toxin-antitoxin system RelE family toxin [Candidatus Woesearchaeota archaeon]
MFEYDLSKEFGEILSKISKKNPALAIGINRKIKEIISRDADTINAYKNLRYSMKDYKRVHITGNVVMIFQVFLKENFILFITIKHRDDVYK